MAIANYSSISTPQINKEPVITDKNYKHAVVDTKYTPSTALLTHLPGMKWSVEYYHQILGSTEEPSPFDPTQASPYQQYQRIINYEILLQGPMDDDIDPETGITVTTGSGILYPGMIPIQGDAFIMDAGDGRACQCTVTSIRRLTMFRDTAYEINFMISRYMDKILEDEINSRVVKKVYFHKDFLKYGQNPFLVEEDHNAELNTSTYIENLAQFWTSKFWVNAHNLFLVPSQSGLAYDPYFTKFVIDLLPIYNSNEYRKMTLINCSDFGLDRRVPVWDLLFKGDTFLLNTIFKESILIPASTFNNAPLFNGVYYSGLDFVIGPKDTNFGYDIGDPNLSNSFTWGTGCSCKCQSSSDGTGLGFVSDVTSSDGTSGTDIPELFKNNYYVFTEEFYNGDIANMSLFERLLWKCVNKESISPSELIPFYDSVSKWSKLDMYYLIPVLILLMKHSLRSM